MKIKVSDGSTFKSGVRCGKLRDPCSAHEVEFSSTQYEVLVRTRNLAGNRKCSSRKCTSQRHVIINISIAKGQKSGINLVSNMSPIIAHSTSRRHIQSYRPDLLLHMVQTTPSHQAPLGNPVRAQNSQPPGFSRP
jgi:hypothetical protein